MTPSGHRSPGRRTFLGGGLLIAVVVLTGCATGFRGTTGTGGAGFTVYKHATGPEDVLISIDQAGGYVPIEYTLRNTAEFLLLGDATVIVQGATTQGYPGPAIYPLKSSTISEAQIQGLFAAADDAGLLGGEVDYGDPTVTDLPSTNVNITIDGRTYSQSVYGLGAHDIPESDISDASRAARLALQEFIDTAQALVGAEGRAYQPGALLAYRVSQSAQTDVEPEFETQPLVWPITTVPAPIAATYPSSCTAITGPEAAELLAAAEGINALTPWLIGLEPPTRMVFRPLLPGDPGCQR